MPDRAHPVAWPEDATVQEAREALAHRDTASGHNKESKAKRERELDALCIAVAQAVASSLEEQKKPGVYRLTPEQFREAAAFELEHDVTVGHADIPRPDLDRPRAIEALRMFVDVPAEMVGKDVQLAAKDALLLRECIRLILLLTPELSAARSPEPNEFAHEDELESGPPYASLDKCKCGHTRSAHYEDGRALPCNDYSNGKCKCAAFTSRTPSPEAL